MNFFSLNSPFARGINKLVMMLYVGILWFFVYFPLLFIMGISGYMQAAIFDHIFQNLIDQGEIANLS